MTAPPREAPELVGRAKLLARGLGADRAQGPEMDHRMGDLAARMASVESGQRWALGLIVTSWLTIGTAVLGLYLRG